jgi:Lysyl oxidase
MVVDGCTPDEVVRKSAQRCLRFDTILANLGSGPLEVAYTADPENGGLAAYQRTYRSDGTYESIFAIETEYHPTHAHFHIQDFYLAKLWRLDKKNRVKGKRPVAQSDKNGFCPEDSAPAQSAPQQGHYSCYAPSADTDGALSVVGISPGWADIYPSNLPDQYIEITGLSNGKYLFEIEIDPLNVFVESEEEDNRVCLGLHLDDGSASSFGIRKCPKRF